MSFIHVNIVKKHDSCCTDGIGSVKNRHFTQFIKTTVKHGGGFDFALNGEKALLHAGFK